MSKHAKRKSFLKPASILTSLGVMSVSIATSVSAVTVDVDGQALKFNSGKNNGTGSLISQPDGTTGPSNDIGENLVKDQFVDFYNVITVGGEQVDARVTVLELVDQEGTGGTADQIEFLDESDGDVGENDYLKVQTDYQIGSGNSYAEIKVAFFSDLAGTPEAVTLENLKMSTYDIDSYQYVELNNFNSYSVSTNSTLEVSKVRGSFTRFRDTSGASQSGVDSSTKGRATVNFDSASEIVFRVGKVEPEGRFDTGSSTYYLDFSVGRSWSGLEASVETAPSAITDPYRGPVPKIIGGCVPPSGGEATLTGERLAGISSASVDGETVSILESSDSALRLSFPPLAVGTYDISYISSAGKLTHLSSLRVCEEAEKQSFYVFKRFSSYVGDRGGVVASDKAKIQSFIEANPGLERVTCLGSTSGVPAVATDAALAQSRATNACSIVEELVPGVTTKTAYVTGRGVGQFHRAVVIYGVGTR